MAVYCHLTTTYNNNNDDDDRGNCMGPMKAIGVGEEKIEETHWGVSEGARAGWSQQER